MRGKAENFPVQSGWQGITPAYAGKSEGSLIWNKQTGDHPRLCGEKLPNVAQILLVQGSPPPMRGKGLAEQVGEYRYGITPAYAGKSYIFEEWTRTNEDHPRLCGEKFACSICANCTIGSPPPMRGKAYTMYANGCLQRITPAYAGKSSTSFTAKYRRRDHPRLCGEKQCGQ